MLDYNNTKIFHNRVFILTTLLCFIFSGVMAQSELEIMHADLFGYERDGEKFQQLTNNVIVRQDNLMLYCDSALKNDTRNLIDAFGHVRLVQGDSLTVTGSTLHYDGNTRVANIDNHVVLTQPEFTLNTEQLIYDTKSKIGYYPVFGKITNKGNTLMCNSGYYYADQKMSYFKQNVDLRNKDYHITCDTLKYDNQHSIAFFTGFTTIVKIPDSTVITCNNGWYDKQKGSSQFSKDVKIGQPQQTMWCDSINWNNELESGDAWRNIIVYDSTNKLKVTGNYGYYDRKNQLTKISNRAIATQLIEKDSMHLHGDTIFYFSDTTRGKKIIAYHNVKIYKSNMQAVADSLYYGFKDSLMVFYNLPIVWIDSTQLTADTIAIRFQNQKVSELLMRRNCFIASVDDTLRFNQIKGRNINGYFEANKLRLVKVVEEGECVYYVKDEANAYLGVNKITSNLMDIYLDSGKVTGVNYKGKPDGILYPVNELTTKELLLKRFFWYDAMRPKGKNDLLK